MDDDDHLHRLLTSMATPTTDPPRGGLPALRSEATLSSLSRRQVDCAVLRWYLGYSTDEVARALRIRPATVRVHLHAARVVLRPRAASLGVEAR